MKVVTVSASFREKLIKSSDILKNTILIHNKSFSMK